MSFFASETGQCVCVYVCDHTLQWVGICYHVLLEICVSFFASEIGQCFLYLFFANELNNVDMFGGTIDWTYICMFLFASETGQCVRVFFVISLPSELVNVCVYVCHHNQLVNSM